MDVKTAFLHGDLEEEIYMHQPVGFEERGNESLVCRLRKSLYGLKQAPRQWYMKFENFMEENGFLKCDTDHCCFIKRYDKSFVILLIYVDDMLISGPNMAHIEELKTRLSECFEMKDLGPANHILGMRITRDRSVRRLRLSQKAYVEKILEKFGMEKAKPVGSPFASHFKLSKTQAPKTVEERESMADIPYASAVGSLVYAMVCTRPDIVQGVGVVSRYMSDPGKEHWNGVKWLLRYLRGSSDRCIEYGGMDLKLDGYCDADYAGDIDSRRSTSGYIFTLGGGAISWRSKLQDTVALSTTEAEYVAAAEAAKELLWLKAFLLELGVSFEKYLIHCDSQSAIHLSENDAFHARTKHVDVKHHAIRRWQSRNELKLVKIDTRSNPADMLTKPVPLEKVRLCAASYGLH
jgi:ATP-binding cassette subfamily B (MDR/TAP) protein 1